MSMGISGRIAQYFQQSALTPLLALILFLAGVFAATVTPREEEPQIDVTMANVFVPFPGASAKDVESLVATPAEPSIATGANAANKDLHYVGISGDGDSLSIGFGQFAHVIRRNVNMLYICENNGVYGLTKGQFSASADIGTKSKKGEENQQAPVDPCLAALSLGGTFIARSFSGDKEQLVPLIQAGLMHNGFAMIDIISPCVTFNDHVGSTKSYTYAREHYHEAVHADYIPPRQEIKASYAEGEALPVQMHDGSQIVLRKLDKDYDPTHRGKAFEYLRTKLRQGEHVTGLIFVSSSGPDMHAMADTTDVPLNQVPYEKLHPGSDGLAKILKRYA